MHVMIRRYRMSGSMDDLMQRVDKQFASQLSTEDSAHAAAPVQLPEGIVSYQAVRTGDDTLLTITAFESAMMLERAQQAAADIRKSLAEFDVEEIETFSGRVDISHASTTLMTPRHPDAVTP